MVLGQALIFRPHDVLAVGSFEAAHGEMALSDLLKMLDKQVVHGSTAQCTDDRKSLRCELLRHHDSEARSHLRNEADENRGSFLDNAALQYESCGFSYGLREQTPHGEITAF